MSTTRRELTGRTVQRIPSTLDPLAIRRRLGRGQWIVPIEFGDNGWCFDTLPGLDRARIIVDDGPAGDDLEGTWWRHASISRADRMPDYEDLKHLHAAIWPNGWAYQCFAPPEHHINIHAHALHLYGRPDGAPCLPNFGALGSI